MPANRLVQTIVKQLNTESILKGCPLVRNTFYACVVYDSTVNSAFLGHVAFRQRCMHIGRAPSTFRLTDFL